MLRDTWFRKQLTCIKVTVDTVACKCHCIFLFKTQVLFFKTHVFFSKTQVFSHKPRFFFHNPTLRDTPQAIIIVIMYEITNRTLQVLNPIKIKHSTTYGSPSNKRTVTIRCTHRYAAVSFIAWHNFLWKLQQHLMKIISCADRERTAEQRGLANFEIPVS